MSIGGGEYPLGEAPRSAVNTGEAGNISIGSPATEMVENSTVSGALKGIQGQIRQIEELVDDVLWRVKGMHDAEPRESRDTDPQPSLHRFLSETASIMGGLEGVKLDLREAITAFDASFGV
jgi:hypothetical protein